MIKHRLIVFIFAVFCCSMAAGIMPWVQAVDVKDTRLLSTPAVSDAHIAFVYAEDLWICDIDGKGVRRLTTHKGLETNPRFSPDGQWLAFSGQYDGNTDVFIVPVEGGSPKRLTWHPSSDLVQDFTKDSTAVLFTSPREAFVGRANHLYEVSVEGGHPVKLAIPSANKACFSPDNSRIAYTPLREAFLQWKNYRGGTASRIWLYNRSDLAVEQIPQPEGRCNDTDPMWIDDKVYFRSDRDGEFNLFSYDPASKSVEALTGFDRFPILNASAGAGRIIFEQAGYLHLYDVTADKSGRLVIGVAADLIERRPRYVSDSRFIRSGSLSPSGSRAVFGFRGEILTVPAKDGDPRNLTQTQAVHEHTPAWSPDGRHIAFFSDASGEYALHIAPQNGKGEVKTYPLPGAGFYDQLRWSPDSEKLGFSDNSWTLYWFDVESGESHAISSEPIYGPRKTQTFDWSPDSRWIAYTRTTPTYFQRVFLYSIEEKKSYPVTDGLSDVGQPAFDASGKYLYMAASTDAGPVRQWFAMSNADMEMTNSLYLAVLQKDEESPLKRKSDEEEVEEDTEESSEESGNEDSDTEETNTEESSDEETGEEAAAEAGEQADEAAIAEEGDATAEETAETDEDEDAIHIDIEGLDTRIISLPVSSSMYFNLASGKEKKLYYLKLDRGIGRFFRGFGGATLCCFDLEKRKEDTLGSGIAGFSLSAKGDKMLVTRGGGQYAIVNAGAPVKGGEGQLSLDRIRVRIDPTKEWPQIYHEAWRINRDCFYDPDMHGADWPAMREKYQVFLPHLAVRSDLNRVIQWMCSELAVGHHNVGGGDFMRQPDFVPGGLLGADYEIHEGRYRFKKVLGGLNWNPDLRSPLTEPGVDVKEGEYLLAVEGRDLRAPENLYSRFENTAGRTIEITVGTDPEGSDARTVRVEPLSHESTLRNRDWVEGNLKRVTEATDGRVAYVHVPNTTRLGHTYFKRYFFPQADRDAIIIDERFNGGGQVADYYIDILRRPVLCHWATRYGQDFKTPLSSIQGPKVMLINESAGSGGDLLPWMFRKLGLGTLVGRPTWGGLVGVLGFPPLMDGARVSAPNLGIWTEDGFIVENVGVPPDVEVEQYPAEMIDGRDPQLEKAIEIALEELKANPPKKAERPPFPVRVRK